MKLVDFTAQAMVFQQKVGFGGGLIYIYICIYIYIATVDPYLLQTRALPDARCRRNHEDNQYQATATTHNFEV